MSILNRRGNKILLMLPGGSFAIYKGSIKTSYKSYNEALSAFLEA